MLEGVILVLLVANVAMAFSIFLILKAHGYDKFPQTPAAKPIQTWFRAKETPKRKPIVMTDESEWKKEQEKKSRA